MVLEKEKETTREGCCADFKSFQKCCGGFFGTEKPKEKPKEETEGK